MLSIVFNCIKATNDILKLHMRFTCSWKAQASVSEELGLPTPLPLPLCRRLHGILDPTFQSTSAKSSISRNGGSDMQNEATALTSLSRELYSVTLGTRSCKGQLMELDKTHLDRRLAQRM